MGNDACNQYIVTTTNPGNLLLILTFIVSLGCFILGGLSGVDGPFKRFISSALSKTRLGSSNATSQVTTEKVPEIVKDGDTSRKNRFIERILSKTRRGHSQATNQEAAVKAPEIEGKDSQRIENNYHLQQEENIVSLRSKRKLFGGKKRYGGIQSSESMRWHGDPEMNKKVKITVQRKATRVGRFEEKLEFSDFQVWRRDSVADGPFIIDASNGSVDDASVMTENSIPVLIKSGEGSEAKDNLLDSDNFDSVNNEMMVLFRLAAPWMLQSLVTDISEIIYMMFISHYLGLSELVCYSIVWFILSTAQIFAEAFHSSVYKHLVAAVGQETSEGNMLAGRYVQIGVCGTIIMMLPISILVTYSMPEIVNWIGYSYDIVDMSRSVAIVASITQLVSSCGCCFSSLLDIEGHAKFNAIFDFWESLAQTSINFLFIILFRPSLFTLTLFNCFFAINSTLLYMYMTFEKRRMYDSFKEGLLTPIQLKMLSPLKSIFSESMPFVYNEIAGTFQSIMFTIFASYQGAAEVATWILMGTIWGIIEIVPECIGSAATVRVESNLARGKLDMAKTLALRTIFVCTATSIMFSLFLMDTRRYVAWCLSLDETLETMILEIIPYIALCQPFITAGVTAGYLNEVLGKIKLSIGVATVIDLCFTMPVAALFTYLFRFNVEGLASATCMGYAATGVADMIIFASTDWEYAAIKIQRYIEG